MREATRLPGVSAEELVALVTVHLDRVHDAVRRLGCDARAAVEVVETSALDLVDAVAGRPETVADALGWWLQQARRLGLRVRQSAAETADPLPVGGGLLSADDDQVVLSEVLEELPEPDRAALLMRDSYDLPLVSVAGALATDTESAMERVGRARLAFLGRADDAAPPAVPVHAGSVAALARLGETGRATAADATARRHARSCADCGAVVEAQRRAHLLLAGLTVVALPAAERASLVARIEEQAFASLPSTATLLVTGEEEWDDEDELGDRWFSPLLATLGVVLAALLGLGLGVVIDRLDSPALDRREAAANVLPPVTAPPVLSPAPGPATARPPDPQITTRVFEVPSPTPSPAAPPPAAPAPGLSVQPASGLDGAVLTVIGTGWLPGAEVQLAYLREDGTPTGSVATASADERGAFRAELTASDPTGTPGRHLVRADDGTQSATAPYDVTG